MSISAARLPMTRRDTLARSSAGTLGRDGGELGDEVGGEAGGAAAVGAEVATAGAGRAERRRHAVAIDVPGGRVAAPLVEPAPGEADVADLVAVDLIEDSC